MLKFMLNSLPSSTVVDDHFAGRQICRGLGSRRMLRAGRINRFSTDFWNSVEWRWSDRWSLRPGESGNIGNHSTS